jgi:hypothetical protein
MHNIQFLRAELTEPFFIIHGDYLCKFFVLIVILNMYNGCYIAQRKLLMIQVIYWGHRQPLPVLVQAYPKAWVVRFQFHHGLGDSRSGDWWIV